MSLADDFIKDAGQIPASPPVSGPLAAQFVKDAGSAPVAQSPTTALDGQSTLQNVLSGAGKFVSDTGTGSKQLINDLAVGLQGSLSGTSVGNGIDWLNQKLGLQSPKDIQQQGRNDIAESRKLDAPLMDTTAGKIGYGGAALITAPLLPAASGYRGAAVLGVGMGATQPALDWAERARNTGISALSGVAGQGVVNGVGRMIQPQTSQAVKGLMDEGITLTPGQILGGGFKKAEEGATSIPILGDFVKNAQNRGIGQLNDAVANRALAPVGERLPAGLSGREAVDYVGTTLGSKYDALLPKLGAQVDAPFMQSIQTLRQMVNGGNMGPAEAKQFSDILQNQVLNKFQGQGAITGETAKGMNSELGRLASNYSRDPSFDKRQLGDAIGEVQDALRGLMTRNNPQYAKELNNIDTGWANFKRMQRASAGVGADGGVFNPSQLQNSVKAMDRSKDKGAFARGDALMQDLSDPAKSVMAPKLNDSGTPYRSLVMAAAAGAAGHLINPLAAIPALAAPLMYSAAGQRAMGGLLTQRPAFAPHLAGLLGATAPAAAVVAPALSYAVQQ